MIPPIFSILVYLSNATITWQYAAGVFGEKRKKRWLCLLYFLGFGIAYLAFNFSTVWLNTLVYTVMEIFIFLLGYACTVRSAVFHSVLLTMLLSASEIAVIAVLGILFRDFSKYQTNLAVYALVAVISGLLYFMLTKVCLFVSHGKEERSAEGPVPLLLGLFPLASLAVVTVQFNIAEIAKLDDQICLLVAVSSFILLFANFLVFVVYQYYKKLNQKYLLLELERQREKANQEYLQAMDEHYAEQRILIHDIRRHLSMIQEMADEAGDRKVSDYVGELEELPELRRQARYCGQPVVNSILSRYGESCRKKGIAYSADVRGEALDFMAPSDITALLGNLLENAVEAASGSPSPYVEFAAEVKQPQSFVLVSIVNACEKEPQENADGYVSGKDGGERHGIGLRSVQRIVKKYNGTIKQYYAPEEKAFHSVVVLPSGK